LGLCIVCTAANVQANRDTMCSWKKWRIMKPILTRKLAWAAATDAGNAHMRKAGRTKWNQADYNAAVAKFNELWPEERDIAEALANPGVPSFLRTDTRLESGGNT
jgi:hypothetical protein